MLNNKQFKLLLENIKSREEIEVLLKKYKIENYVINVDGSVDVDGDVKLYNKKLTKLPFKFSKVRGSFYCSGNQLVNLEGSPQIVEGNFNCDCNQLVNLVGAPQKVGIDFNCSGNEQLTSLEGVPEFLGGEFPLLPYEWERLNPFKELEPEVSLDDMTDIYDDNNYASDLINVKDYLYKDNRLIKR
jgi:hypothetical protein